MGDQEIPSNVRIRDDDEELVAHPDGKEGSVFLRPIIQCQLRTLAEEGIADWRPWRQSVAICIRNPFSEKYGSEEVDRCSYHAPYQNIVTWADNKLEKFA